MPVAVFGGLALAIGLPPASVQAEDCVGVEMQHRLALANCLIDSAVAIAAALVQYQGCHAGEWDMRALVDEYYLKTFPIHGSLSVTNENESYLLNGIIAPLFGNLLCRASSEDIESLFAGVPFTYSSGRNDYYPDAVIDPQSTTVCVNEYESSGRVSLDVPGTPKYIGQDTLAFNTDGTTIFADGALLVTLRGLGGSVDVWSLGEDILMPPLDALQVAGFKLEGSTAGCRLGVEADIYNGGAFVPEFGFGLDIFGTLKIEAEAQADVKLYLSLANNSGLLRGLGPNGSSLAYTDDDILSWNGTNYAIVFDGAAAGLRLGAEIAAFDVDTTNNRILMAFETAETVPGLDRVSVTDIVAFDLDTGTFSLFFDGSDVGLAGPDEAIDGLQLLSDGRLVLSTRDQTAVPSGSLLPYVVYGQDLLAFTPTRLGADTQGSWSIYLDGSRVGLETSDEGVDAVAVAANGDVYLSTQGFFSLMDLTGEDEDVFVCTPAVATTGTITDCAFVPFFDGTAYGLAGDNVDAIDLP
jgi:hypothetical protein